MPRVRPEARAAPFKTGGGSQIAHYHRLAAGIAHQLRGKLNGLAIVPGEGNTQLAASRLAEAFIAVASTALKTRTNRVPGRYFAEVWATPLA